MIDEQNRVQSSEIPVSNAKNLFSKEQLLQGIYKISILLDNFYPMEDFKKEVFFCYLTGALIDEFTTIIVVSDYITIARMFVESIIAAIPLDLVRRFNGHTIKELAKLDLKSRKILYLTNFVKNRELIEEIALSDNKGVNFGEDQKIPKLTIVSVARKHEFYSKFSVPKNITVIELSDTTEQSRALTKFAMTQSTEIIVNTQQELRTILERLNKDIDVKIPYMNTLIESCFSHIVPDAFIEHKKFLLLLQIVAFLNQEDREQISVGSELVEIISHPVDLKYTKKIGKFLFIRSEKRLPPKLSEFLNYIFKWVFQDNHRQLPGGYYFRKKLIDQYCTELNLKITLITKYKGLISKGKLTKKEREQRNANFLRLVDLKLNKLELLNEDKIVVHDRKTYEGYFKHLSVDNKVYNYLEETKSGKNCVFRLIKAPPLRPFDFLEIQDKLEEEYNNYINNFE